MLITIMSNLISHYAMAITGFICTSIVDYERKDSTCDINDYDKYPELNIYEKIQIILYENQFIQESPRCVAYSNFSNDNKIKSIPIPKKKPSY